MKHCIACGNEIENTEEEIDLCDTFCNTCLDDPKIEEELNPERRV